MNKNINPEIIIILLPLILGFTIGFLFKPDKWYLNLKKPSLIPPPILFSIVWFILYIMIGVSYYIALKNKQFIYWIFPIIHLLLNLLYTPLLFGAHNLILSSIVLLLTLITAIIVLILFYIYDKTGKAYKLLIPYILWLLVANYLGWSVYFLN